MLFTVLLCNHPPDVFVPAAVLFPQALKELGIKVVAFDELRETGRAKPAEAVPPSPDDYSTIM
jgi:hypothetical protein